MELSSLPIIVRIGWLAGTFKGKRDAYSVSYGQAACVGQVIVHVADPELSYALSASKNR